MFEHPKDLPFDVRETKEVKLRPEETVEAAYKLWFANVSAKPRYCEKHRHIELILNNQESCFWPVYEYHGYSDMSPKPGEFNFRAVFVCPSYRVAYALCPPEFHQASFGTFDASTPERSLTLAKTREFAAQVNAHGCGFLLLVGPPGAGKTRLASNVIQELKDRDALYVRQGGLTNALRATYSRKDVILHRQQRRYDDDDEATDDEPPTPLEIVQRVRFLILDEIGCVALANDERLFLDELLKYRFEYRKPTTLISNLPLSGAPDKPGLKEFLGDALTDRIQEATGNGKFIVQFASASYRRTAGESYLGGLA